MSLLFIGTKHVHNLPVDIARRTWTGKAKCVKKAKLANCLAVTSSHTPLSKIENLCSVCNIQGWNLYSVCKLPGSYWFPPPSPRLKVIITLWIHLLHGTLHVVRNQLSRSRIYYDCIRLISKNYREILGCLYHVMGGLYRFNVVYYTVSRCKFIMSNVWCNLFLNAVFFIKPAKSYITLHLLTITQPEALKLLPSKLDWFNTCVCFLFCASGWWLVTVRVFKVRGDVFSICFTYPYQAKPSTAAFAFGKRSWYNGKHGINNLGALKLANSINSLSMGCNSNKRFEKRLIAGKSFSGRLELA